MSIESILGRQERQSGQPEPRKDTMRKDTVVARKQQLEICSGTFRFIALKHLKKINDSSLVFSTSQLEVDLLKGFVNVSFVWKAWPPAALELWLIQ